MCKVNKIRVSIIIVCIALLLFNMFATVNANGTDSTGDTGTNTLQGTGSQIDPYILDFPNSAVSKIEINYTSLPFYFEVAPDSSEIGRVYSVSFNPDEKIVTFIRMDSVNLTSEGVTNFATLVDEKTYKNGPWQLGISPANEGDLSTTPLYSIQEISKYYTTSEEAEEDESSKYWDEYTQDYATVWKIRFDTLNGFTQIGKNKKGYVSRTLELKNVSSNISALQSAKSDLYYFTYSRTKNNIEDLIKPLYYEDVTHSSEYNNYLKDGFSLYKKDFLDQYYYGTDINTKYDYIYPKILYIPNNDLSDLSSTDYAAEIIYKFNGYSNTALNEDGENVNFFEMLITKLFLSIGDTFLLGSLQSLLGTDLTINSLIFNQYEPTRIDLYNEGGTTLNQVLRNVINNWFNIFAVLAYICFVVILVYIAIMIIISAGTEKQSKMKTHLTNWIVGLMLLYCIPKFVIPALFDINDAFVSYISQGRMQIETYYNIYSNFSEIGRTKEFLDIFGSDSTTVSIEELQKEADTVSEEIKNKKEELSNKSLELANDIGGLDEPINKLFFETLYREIFTYFDARLEAGHTIVLGEETYNAVVEHIVRQASDKNVKIFEDPNALLNFTENFDNNALEMFYTDWLQYRNNEAYWYLLTDAIEVVQNDFMGQMRTLAGKTHRFIYAVVWFILIFQLIALVFLYYKRIFIIAILIAIFPLIMIFYCIDKMSDGSAQTLSMWFKELLSNIFIQSVHAVIYTILIEMGLKIFQADNSNWVLFVTTMLMIISAEGIMKSIFGLDGSTLGNIGGALTKTAMAIGAAGMFLTARQTSKDAAFQKKVNKRFDRLQNSQRRADNKASLRASRRALRGKDASFMGRRRDNLYHAATDVRKFAAKASPKVSAVKRELKNTAAIAGGIMYGAAGGDIESMYAGAQMAKTASGRTSKLDEEDRDIKSNLEAAYKRKSKKS